jgi:hypothetical protein
LVGSSYGRSSIKIAHHADECVSMTKSVKHEEEEPPLLYIKQPNPGTSTSIDASDQVSVHLAKRLQKRRIF